MIVIFITAIIIRRVRHTPSWSPSYASWLCSPLTSLCAPPLCLHRRIPCQRMQSCRAARVQNTGCEPTEAACIYRLSEYRNVLLTVQAIYRASLLMSLRIQQEKRCVSWELLTRLPHICLLPPLGARPLSQQPPSSCFTLSILFLPASVPVFSAFPIF